MATMFERNYSTVKSNGPIDTSQLSSYRAPISTQGVPGPQTRVSGQEVTGPLVRQPSKVTNTGVKDKVKGASTSTGTATSSVAASTPMPSQPAAGDAVWQRHYPLDLPRGNDGYFFHLLLGEYNEQVALNDRLYMMCDVSIALPIPSNLLTATALDYSNVGLGALGGELLKSVLNIKNSGDALQQLRTETNTVMRELFKSGDSDLRSTIFRRIVSQASPTLGSAIDIASGSTPNPHIAVTFNNVKFRTFSYTWRFSPNSAAESAALDEIIRKLNERILPKKSGRLLLKYPNQAGLALFPQQLNSLFQFKPCVVESMNVNYAPSGTPSFFADTKLPTEVELTLNFQEITIRTSEEYQ